MICFLIVVTEYISGYQNYFCLTDPSNSIIMIEQSISNPNQTEETVVEEYFLSDGTRVIKTTITTRIKPSGPDPNLNLENASEFERAFLSQHNQYRALHGVPPLQLSRDVSKVDWTNISFTNTHFSLPEQICNYAQEWADVIAKENKLHTRPNKPYGENVFTKRSGSMRITGEEPVKNWYQEGAKLYQWYGGEPPGGFHAKSGNFTQVVWRESERVGVGLAINGNSFYVVANYDPPGNCFTRFKHNVLALKK